MSVKEAPPALHRRGAHRLLHRRPTAPPVDGHRRRFWIRRPRRPPGSSGPSARNGEFLRAEHQNPDCFALTHALADPAESVEADARRRRVQIEMHGVLLFLRAMNCFPVAEESCAACETDMRKDFLIRGACRAEVHRVPVSAPISRRPDHRRRSTCVRPATTVLSPCTCAA